MNHDWCRTPHQETGECKFKLLAETAILWFAAGKSHKWKENYALESEAKYS